VKLVILVRHAIAHERSAARWPDDSQRPLTATGKRKFRKVARGLSKLLPERAPILTSPFVRAAETAAMLAAVYGGRPVQCAELAARQPTRALFELVRMRPGKTAILVGHEPDLSRFLATAIGDERARLAFKKGGAASLVFPNRIAPRAATLEWLIPPRVLRALR
jgi:phosphohistidine phosphatase